MGRSTDKETGLSEQRKYRSWTAQQKLEILLAGMRGDRLVREVYREHGIAETLYYGWRDKILEAGVGVSVRVAQARVLVAEGEALAAVARVMQISPASRVPNAETSAGTAAAA